jgi:predicted O-linked N-acetylglucosamine transferase (SPINDLY family)
VCAEDESAAAISWLRERLRANGDTCAIWASGPVSALAVLAARVAPVQIYWSLRYHPIRLPEIDGYITYGSWNERERVFHGQAWTVAPAPLALGTAPIAAADIERTRAQFPERIALGTLAREDKIASRPFLEAAAEILRRHPEAGWVWTGHAQHPGVAAFMRERGVDDRCHFVGWVDTALYAAALDVFLETFPLGCGITGYQAIAAGVPLVSYLDSNTVFGMRYWSEVLEKAGSREAVSRELLDGYPVLCARDPGEYVQAASRLISDDAYRAHWTERESRFYAEDIANIGRYSQRFFDTVRGIRARVESR